MKSSPATKNPKEARRASDPDAKQRTEARSGIDSGKATKEDSWVYEESGRSLVWRLRDIYRLYTSALEPLVSHGGITVGHWYYLRILSEQDGLIQQELSQRVGIHPNTAVPALVNMEKHDLIRRVRSPEDRRRSRVFLTTKGRRLRDQIQPQVREMVSQSVLGLSATELAVLFRALDQIETHLRKVTKGMPPPPD